MATEQLPLPNPTVVRVPAPPISLRAVWFAVLLVPVLLWPYLGMPLDRDEGEYAYAADLWLRGGLPYRDTFLQKPPGIILAYLGTFHTLGTDAVAIHLALLLVYAANATLLGLLATRLFDTRAAVLAVTAFALSLTSRLYGAQSFNTEALMLLPLLGCALLLTVPTTRAAVGAGLLFGLAGMCKQVAGAHLLVLVPLLWLGPDRSRRLFAFFLPAAMPFTLSLVWAAAHGILPQYLDAVLWHDLAYVGGTLEEHGWVRLERARDWLTVFDIALWALALAAPLRTWRRRPRLTLVLAGWLVSAIWVASLGGYWRDHYFLAALPVVCLLAAWGLSTLGPRLRLGALAVLLVAYLVTDTALYRYNPYTVSVRRFQTTRFVAAASLGKWLQQWPDSSLYVFASEPELYHYSGRRGTSRYPIFTPLFGGLPDAHERQAEVWRDLTARPPFQIVVSGFVGPVPIWAGSDLTLLRRMNGLLLRDYEEVGRLTVTPDWRFEMRANPVGELAHFVVFQRRATAAVPSVK